MPIVANRFYLADDIKAAALSRDKEKIVQLHILANGVNARNLNDKPYSCKTCGIELKMITTHTKTWGDISVMATDCEPCRLATIPNVNSDTGEFKTL